MAHLRPVSGNMENNGLREAALVFGVSERRQETLDMLPRMSVKRVKVFEALLKDYLADLQQRVSLNFRGSQAQSPEGGMLLKSSRASMQLQERLERIGYRN